jgi:hypothetical protein
MVLAYHSTAGLLLSLEPRMDYLVFPSILYTCGNVVPYNGPTLIHELVLNFLEHKADQALTRP